MIDAATLKAHLLDRLAPVFGEPKNAEGIAGALVSRVPDHATAEALERVADRLIETRKAKGFPSAAELIAAVKGIPATVGGGQVIKARFGKAAEQGGGDAEERARRLLRGTDLARRAVAERWGPGLFEFTVKNGRAPDLGEERPLIAQARANDALARENSRVLDGGLIRLRELMHWRAAQDLGIEVQAPPELELRPKRGTKFTPTYRPGADAAPAREYTAADLAPSPVLLGILGADKPADG